MSDTRWTVRHVERAAIAKLREIASVSGEPIGVLVTAAIEDWYRRLPSVDDPIEPMPIEPVDLAQLFRG